MHDSAIGTNAPTGREERPSLRMCLQRLAEINRLLSQSSVDVEEALALAEEGAGLHAEAESILSQARLRVRHLASREPNQSSEAAPQGFDRSPPEQDLPS